MSKLVAFNSIEILKNSVKVICDIHIPIFGEEKDEVYDERSEAIFPLLKNQYTSGVLSVIADYEESVLPDQFIRGQEIIVTSLPMGLYGLFNLVGDDMIVDADTISNVSLVPASFLFGHEMGHKIAKYRATGETYDELASILGISSEGNYLILNETYADECGNMVSSKTYDHGILPLPLSTQKREGVKRLILKSICR